MKELLITSSVLIVVILLVRGLFRGKVSQKLIYAAWLLVALRLLIPVQFGQSRFSVTTLAEKAEAQSRPIQQVQQTLQEPVAGPSRAELYNQLLGDYLQENPVPEAPENPNTPSNSVTVSPDVQQAIEARVEELTAPTLGEILTAVWIVGICGMAAWFITANILFLNRARKDAVETEIGGIQVRISPNVPTPCVVGLFRPVIYLTPACAENDQSRTHVLAHERAHLRHGDHIWALVRCLCLCIYWFDPLVWVAAGQSRRDCELACDESALKKLGDSERIAYGKTLLDIVSQSMSPVHLLETATAMNESKKQLKERVNYIVKKPRNILIAAVCMTLIAALTTGCVFLGAQPAITGVGDPPPVNGSVTKPGYKRVYLLTELTNYFADGIPSIQYRYTYDENGQLIKEVYRNSASPDFNHTRTISRNEHGLLSTVTVEGYRTGSFTDLGYNQLTVSSYYNYTFDNAGRLTGYDFTNDDDLTHYTFQYDSRGCLVTRSWQHKTKDPQYNHFVYDAHGRLIKIITSEGYGYDLKNHSFSYDEQGRLSSLSSGFSMPQNRRGTTSYEYDPQGHLVREVNPDALELSYTWENGILTAIDCVSSSSGNHRSYALDDYGNVTRITWENGKWTEFKYIAVELPDEYADRALLQHRVIGPWDPLAAYSGNITDYLLPYGEPSIQTWDKQS